MRTATLALALVLVTAGGAAAQLAVTAVSVATVKLTAGARASVTLTGTDLDQIQSVAVLKGGGPASGVTAELGAASGKTSRSVTIVSTASAAPGTDYKLQVTGKQPIVTPLTIEIAAPVVAAPPAPAPPVAKVVTPEPAKAVAPPAPEPKAAPPVAATADVKAAIAPAPVAPSAPPAPAAKIVTAPAVEAKIADPKPVDTKVTDTKVAETKPLAVAPASPADQAAAAKTPAAAAPAVQPKAATVPSPATTTLSTAAVTRLAPVAVASAVPASLQLDPGAKLTMAIYGQGLDRLTAVSVAPARAGTAAVTAALGSASPTMRTLTVSAGTTALAGRYQLTALAGTTSLAVNATVEVLARPTPVLLQVTPTADGYVLVGRGFGTDAARVAAYEGSARVSSFVMAVAPERITVRARPSGVVQHRVEVVGVQSGIVTFSHPGPTIGSVGVTSDEMAKILASPKAIGVTVPPTSVAGRTPTVVTPPPVQVTRPQVAAAPSASGPSTGTAVGVARPAPRSAGPFQPRSAVTGELVMTGLGPSNIQGP